MKRISILIFLIAFVIQNIDAENWQRLKVKSQEVVCYASGKVEKGFIPPPAEILYKLKSGQKKSSNIIVTYVNFPDSVKEAFAYAVGLWEQLIDSDVPIYLTATWKSMGVNTLASCGPTGYYRNLEGFHFTDRFYPVAVAEKIYGEEITGSDSPDITASFNRDFSWYIGTDGDCPSNRYDLVSTVMHELAHGLGFTGFFYVQNDQGGYYTPPAIFDQYVANFSKEFLIDTDIFANPSTELMDEMTAGSLFFRSPGALSVNNNRPPYLYAPSTYSDGSSIYHLHDNYYPAGNINSMMTHAAGYGEAIHDPGPLTLAILGDIGWKNIFFHHQELKDMETVDNPVYIEVSIKSDYELDSTLLKLFYSFDSFNTSNSIDLVATDIETVFIAELPIDITEGVISYYISAGDKMDRVFTYPPMAPDSVFTFRIGPDNIAPEINHEPREFVLTSTPSMNVSAIITDNIEMGEASVELWDNEGSVKAVGMVNDSGSVYSASLNLLPLNLQIGDTVRYRIVAQDNSANQNIAYLPNDGYFEVLVEEVYAPLTYYENDFNDLSGDDFISNKFFVFKEDGFLDGALQSEHPYRSSGVNDVSYNFKSQLKYPIILQEGGQMNYDEIVLVEPGTDGTVFGDAEFWDYVIVEGSKDHGANWLPLADGYDSRKNLSWVIEYNNGIDGDNSTTVGKKEMYIRSNIGLLENGNFAVGDTILIRFRLFSDPLANGWGWAIDNLQIQEYVSAKNIPLVSPGEFRVYPNPVEEKVSVELNSQNRFNNVAVLAYNSYGKLITIVKADVNTEGFKQDIDLSGSSPGIYLIQVIADGQNILSRKVVKN